MESFDKVWDSSLFSNFFSGQVVEDYEEVQTIIHSLSGFYYENLILLSRFLSRKSCVCRVNKLVHNWSCGVRQLAQGLRAFFQITFRGWQD